MKLRKQNFGTCLTVIQGIVVMCEVNVKILTEGIKLIVLEIIELLACPDGIDDVEMRGSYPVFFQRARQHAAVERGIMRNDERFRRKKAFDMRPQFGKIRRIGNHLRFDSMNGDISIIKIGFWIDERVELINDLIVLNDSQC